VELGRLQALLADAADDRIEQRGRLASPARKRRTVELDALCRHHLRLAVQRQMVVELGHDHVRQRPERRLAARDHLHRSGRLHDALARAAAVLGADVTHHVPADRDHGEQLVRVATERTQHAAT
jgi:hypothetical protein